MPPSYYQRLFNKLHIRFEYLKTSAAATAASAAAADSNGASSGGRKVQFLARAAGGRERSARSARGWGAESIG